VSNKTSSGIVVVHAASRLITDVSFADAGCTLPASAEGGPFPEVHYGKEERRQAATRSRLSNR